MDALELILMRHGEAQHVQPGVLDFERHLTGQGKLEAMGTGASLLAAGLRPDRTWVSQATRASETADQVAQLLDLDRTQMTVTPSLYHASLDHVVAMLQGALGTEQRVMVIAHNPTMSFLATRLSGQTIQLATAEAILLTLEGFSWKEGLGASQLWTVAARWRGGQDLTRGF